MSKSRHNKILEDAKEHYFASSDCDESKLPINGERWGDAKKNMASEINNFSSVEEVISCARGGRGWCFDHRRPVTRSLGKILPLHKIRLPGRMLKYVAPEILDLYHYEHLLKADFPEYFDMIPLISDSMESESKSILKLDTRYVSNIMYYHSMHLLACFRYKKNIKQICEIGGGYGDLARLWATNPIQPIDQYFIVDMPESLFFAEIFLGVTLDNFHIKYISKTSIIDDSYLESKNTIILCPIQMASTSKLFNFDIIVNTGSLGELTYDWNVFWRDWIQEQNADTFYSHNYFMGPSTKIEQDLYMSPMVPAGWYLAEQCETQSVQKIQSHAWELPTLQLMFSRNRNNVNAIDICKNMFSVNKNITMTKNYFIFYLYSLQNCDDVEFLIQFIKKSVKDMPFRYKELVYYIKKITDDERICISDKDRRFISKIYNQIVKEPTEVYKPHY